MKIKKSVLISSLRHVLSETLKTSRGTKTIRETSDIEQNQLPDEFDAFINDVINIQRTPLPDFVASQLRERSLAYYNMYPDVTYDEFTEQVCEIIDDLMNDMSHPALTPSQRNPSMR